MASPSEKLAAERIEKLLQEAATSLAELKARQDEDPVDDLLVEEFEHRVPWRSLIANSVAQTRGCKMYWRGGDIRVVGRRSDIYAVVYTFLQLCRDVNRLTEQGWRNYWITTRTEETESMRAWKNNFRLGIASALETRLQAMNRDPDEAVRNHLARMVLGIGDDQRPTLPQAFDAGVAVGNEVAFDGPTRLKVR